jgi:hypothetical protein
MKKRVILVKRTGEGHTEGEVYVLDTKEKIDTFMTLGKILQDKF